jgi:hypothetical protein
VDDNRPPEEGEEDFVSGFPPAKTWRRHMKSVFEKPMKSRIGFDGKRPGGQKATLLADCETRKSQFIRLKD